MLSACELERMDKTYFTNASNIGHAESKSWTTQKTNLYTNKLALSWIDISSVQIVEYSPCMVKQERCTVEERNMVFLRSWSK